MNQAFLTYFERNGTNIKCYSNEEWAQQWIEFGSETTPCNTSNLPVAIISWR